MVESTLGFSLVRVCERGARREADAIDGSSSSSGSLPRAARKYVSTIFSSCVARECVRFVLHKEEKNHRQNKNKSELLDPSSFLTKLELPGCDKKGSSSEPSKVELLSV